MKKRVISIVVIIVVALGITLGVLFFTKKAPIDFKKVENWKITKDTKEYNLSDYDLEKYVKLGDYKNMSIDVPKVEVSDEYVIDQLNKAFANFPVYSKKEDDKVVDLGDVANIDYEGYLGDKQFDGGTAEGYHLEIGSGTFIEGFEDGLIGKKVGEKAELHLKFPDNYQNDELKGQNVIFYVTINSVEEKVVYTFENAPDEYINEKFNQPDSKSLFNYVKDYYTQRQQSDAESEIQKAFNDKLIEVNEVKLPEELLQYKILDYLVQYKESVEKSGYKVDEYIKETYNESIEEFTEDIVSMMTASLKQQMALTLIADKEGITIDEDGFNEYLSQFAEYYGYKDADAVLADFNKEELQTAYLCKMTSDKLKEIITINYISQENEGK